MDTPRPDEPAGPPDDGAPDDAARQDPSPGDQTGPARGPADDSPAAPGRSSPQADDDPDATFRAIVEGFGRSSDSPVPPWPVEEDVEPERRSGDSPGALPPRGRQAPPEAALPGWVEPAPVEDEHHYVPPPPPPAPRLRPRTVAASAAVLLGILLIFAPSLLDVAPGAGTSFLGLLLAGGGAGALVYWMRDAPGVDDGPDDGAVV